MLLSTLIQDVFFLKTDANGVSLNEPLVKFSPAPFDQFNVNNFKKVADGYVLAGEGIITSTGVSRMYTYKTSLNFDYQDRSNLGNPGEPGIDVAYDVAETDAGQYVLCGFALQRPDSNGIYLMNTLSGPHISERYHKYIYSNELGARATAIIKISGGYLVAGQKLNGTSLESCFFKLSNTLVPNDVKFFGIKFSPLQYFVNRQQ